MLKVCVTPREAHRRNRRSSTMLLRYRQRDQAIILALRDTGLHGMELRKLLIGKIDLKYGWVEVKRA